MRELAQLGERASELAFALRQRCAARSLARAPLAQPQREREPTSRCWAPSWRSRSSRRRSASAASTMRAREARRSSSCAAASACRRSCRARGRRPRPTSSSQLWVVEQLGRCGRPPRPGPAAGRERLTARAGAHRPHRPAGRSTGHRRRAGRRPRGPDRRARPRARRAARPGRARAELDDEPRHGRPGTPCRAPTARRPQRQRASASGLASQRTRSTASTARKSRQRRRRRRWRQSARQRAGAGPGREPPAHRARPRDPANARLTRRGPRRGQDQARRVPPTCVAARTVASRSAGQNEQQLGRGVKANVARRPSRRCRPSRRA